MYSKSHLPHGFNRSCDFLNSFTLHAKPHEVGGNLGLRSRPLHDLEHDFLGFFFREVDALREFIECFFNHGCCPGVLATSLLGFVP